MHKNTIFHINKQNESAKMTHKKKIFHVINQNESDA